MEATPKGSGLPDKWMPMDTAPRDRRILVYNAFFGVYSSQYTEVRAHVDGVPRSEQILMWSGYPLGLTDVGLGAWYCDATAWMPLPDVPKEEKR